MITLRCTRKLLKYLGIIPDAITQPTTALLGDWYVNLVPVFFGALILFVSEKSLLTIAIPIWESDNLVPLFRNRVANLLTMIGISPIDIAAELDHLGQVQFGKTANLSLLGSMNDFAWHYQIMIEDAMDKCGFSLSEAEYQMSQIPCKPLNYQFPEDVAKKLLNSKGKNLS